MHKEEDSHITWFEVAIYYKVDRCHWLVQQYICHNRPSQVQTWGNTEAAHKLLQSAIFNPYSMHVAVLHDSSNSRVHVAYNRPTRRSPPKRSAPVLMSLPLPVLYHHA